MAKRPADKTPPGKTPPRKPAADPVVATSARELAKLLGVSHTAVNRWIGDERWRFGAGPWRKGQVAAIEIWRAQELVERPTGPQRLMDAAGGTQAAGDVNVPVDGLSPAKKADIALKLKRREVLAFGLDVQKGKFHDVEQCKLARRRAIHEVKTALLDLPNSITTDEGTRAIIKGRVLEILRRFARGMGQPELADQPTAGHPAAAAGPV